MIVRDATLAAACALAKVHVDSWRSAYRGILPDQVLDNLSYDDRLRHWREWLADDQCERITLVSADDADHIFGFASAGPERSGDPIYHSELYAIYVLQSQQRKGSGRQLVRTVVQRLTQRGTRSMLVWVLLENPARRLYEKLGGVPIRTQSIEIAGLPFDEIACGWKNVHRLMVDEVSRRAR